jgi:hypothetical protein
MDMNRNQYFLAGLIILAMGLQFRMVESVTLNKECSEFLHRKLSRKGESGTPPANNVALFGEKRAIENIAELRTLRPPQWLGYALLSVGAVLVLHSLAMRRPE